jgi:hydrogenase maturation protease
VEVLVCGAEDRGDDGAPQVAARFLADQLPADVRIRAIGQLDVDDLRWIPLDTVVVVVDAATGVPPGTVVTLPLDDLATTATIRPRSSHAMSAPEVIGLANLMRERPLAGLIVAIGGSRFGFGADLDDPVADAIPALIDAVLDAVGSLRS